MLKKCCEFEVLITFPYYEWNEVHGRKEKEEEYMKGKDDAIKVRGDR